MDSLYGSEIKLINELLIKQNNYHAYWHNDSTLVERTTEEIISISLFWSTETNFLQYNLN